MYKVLPWTYTLRANPTQAYYPATYVGEFLFFYFFNYYCYCYYYSEARREALLWWFPSYSRQTKERYFFFFVSYIQPSQIAMIQQYDIRVPSLCTMVLLVVWYMNVISQDVIAPVSSSLYFIFYFCIYNMTHWYYVSYHVTRVLSRVSYDDTVVVMDHAQTLRRMRQESKKPTEAAFATAFRAAAELGQVKTAKEIFEHRIEVGLPPQEAVYVKVSPCVLLPALFFLHTHIRYIIPYHTHIRYIIHMCVCM